MTVLNCIRHCCTVFGLTLLIGCAPEYKAPIVAPVYNELGAVEAFYGIDARNRVQAWRQMQRAGQHQSTAMQLKLTNDFFNGLKFEDDSEHWQAEDYWATPLETVATNGGDCEDFALGKYFTLIEQGVPEQCLSMMYVKALSLNKAHMVLTYQCNRHDAKLVLDNLTAAIVPADERSDLIPVYSFNTAGLWLNKPNQQLERINDTAHLSRWQHLLQRINKPLKP